ncbi:MAG: T9SS type A sorting domain-containing protein [Bacteroidota bacterium]
MKSLKMKEMTAALFFSLLPALLYGQICPDPVVDLGNDTVLCPGTNIYLDAGEHDSWLWNDGSTERLLLVTEPGTYSVTVYNDCGNSASDEISIQAGENPELNLFIPKREFFCAGENVEITAEVSNTDGSILYKWSEPDANDATISVDTSKNISLEVTNEDGCKASRELFVEFQFPFEQEKILLATYDPLAEKNVVIYSKTRQKRTRTFAIYNGNTENDFLGHSNFANTNLFIDNVSDPYQGPQYYNLRVVDSCDNYSNLRTNKAHRTIHLKASTIDGNASLLEWNKYLGFEYDYFYLYRGTEQTRLELIDSIPNDPKIFRYSYVDRNSKKDILYYYNVKVKTPETIYLDDEESRKAGSGPFVHSLSNLDDNMIKSTGMSELDYIDQYFRIYPNPLETETRISYKLENEKNVRLSLFDITGKEVARLVNSKHHPGEHEMIFYPADYGISSGIFLLKMEIEDSGILIRKLISKN